MAETFARAKSSADVVRIYNEMHKDLNQAQYNAATTTEGPVMVIASAGAGKTKALIHRCASLIVKNVPPASIVIVTFTAKAASVIRDRLQSMIGEDAQYVNAGTFHSIVFQKMLKPFPDSQYLQGEGIDMNECSIMDEDDAKSLLKSAVEELDQAEREWLEIEGFGISDIQSAMSLARCDGTTVAEFARSIQKGPQEQFQRIVANVWTRYNALCRTANGLDFDDILVHANKMLKTDTWIAEKLGTDFKYLMLDEYQDTNPVQMGIMDEIAKYHRNIFVVGDEKQSIYAFRGSDIGVIMSFQKRYQDATKIDMKDNYRSYPSVINVANACARSMNELLSDGQMRHNRVLSESPEDVGRRRLNGAGFVEFATTYDEARKVTDAIQRDIANGMQPSHISVLYRNKIMRKEIEKEFVRRNMEYNVVNDRSFYERAEVKDAVALLRFVYNPWDSMAGLRILRSTTLGLSEKKAKDLMSKNGSNFSEMLRVSSEQTLKAVKKGEEPQLSASAKKIRPFYHLSRMMRESYEFGDDNQFVMECVRRFWEIYLKSRYQEKAARSKGAGAESELNERIENATFVLDRVEEQLNSGVQMREIIDELSMRSEYNSEMDRNKHMKVQMMTLHGSKGLEFESVYMVGCNDRALPGDTEELSVIEEERRLFYVGMTRAEKKLAVTYARLNFEYGEWKLVSGSPFITEVEAEAKVTRVIMPPTELEEALRIKVEKSEQVKAAKSSKERRPGSFEAAGSYSP